MSRPASEHAALAACCSYKQTRALLSVRASGPERASRRQRTGLLLRLREDPELGQQHAGPVVDDLPLLEPSPRLRAVLAHLGSGRLFAELLVARYILAGARVFEARGGGFRLHGDGVSLLAARVDFAAGHLQQLLHARRQGHTRASLSRDGPQRADSADGGELPRRGSRALLSRGLRVQASARQRGLELPGSSSRLRTDGVVDITEV